MPQDEHEGSRLPIHEMKGLGGFTALVFGSAKDWQDQMQSVLPGQRQRIVRIKLDRKTEGGLNLAMGSTVSENLMDYGEIAGQMVRDKFDFVEHRWRRVLVAYEQLEVLTGTLSKTWPKYADWYPGYVPLSYKGFELPDRQEIGRRLGALTTAGQAMAPPLEASFPRPTGRLHTTPEL